MRESFLYEYLRMCLRFALARPHFSCMLVPNLFKQRRWNGQLSQWLREPQPDLMGSDRSFRPGASIKQKQNPPILLRRSVLENHEKLVCTFRYKNNKYERIVMT